MRALAQNVALLLFVKFATAAALLRALETSKLCIGSLFYGMKKTPSSSFNHLQSCNTQLTANLFACKSYGLATAKMSADYAIYCSYLPTRCHMQAINLLPKEHRQLQCVGVPTWAWASCCRLTGLLLSLFTQGWQRTSVSFVRALGACAASALSCVRAISARVRCARPC